MLKSHIAGQPHSTRQSSPRFSISARTLVQRRSRSLSDSVGYSVSLRIVLPFRRQIASDAKPLERREIVRDAALQIVFRRVAELRPGAGNVVDAGRRIGEAVKIQAAADLHLRVRDVFLDDAFEVAQRHADTGTDVEDAAFELAGNDREINPERGILIVDEVVLVVAALLEL